MDSKHVRVHLGFSIPPVKWHMDHMTKSKNKSSFKIFFFILGLIAQHPKVLARQEIQAVCIVLEVLGTTWCLVWDSQWEGRNISACRSLSFMFIRSFCSVSE